MLPKPTLSAYLVNRVAESCVSGIIMVIDGQEYRVSAKCEPLSDIGVRIIPDLSSVGYTIGLVSKLSFLIQNPFVGSAVFEYFTEVVLFDLPTGGIPIEFLSEIVLYVG